MESFNRVVLVGNLTRDPVLRRLQSGSAVCDIGLAVNERRKNPNGEWVDDPVFVDITLWERTAEIAAEYLTKGSQVLIEGRLRLDKWQDKNDGQPRSKLKITGERLVMLGTRGDRPAGTPGTEGAAARPASRQGSQSSLDQYSQSVPPEDYDAPPADAPHGDAPTGDDIPF